MHMGILAEKEDYCCHKILKGVYDTPHFLLSSKKIKGKIINGSYLRVGENFEFWVFYFCTMQTFYYWGRVL